MKRWRGITGKGNLLFVSMYMTLVVVFTFERDVSFFTLKLFFDVVGLLMMIQIVFSRKGGVVFFTFNLFFTVMNLHVTT